jgi:hypothetical protein
MDYEDMNRILSQLHEDEADLFEKWLDEHYCCACPYYNKSISEG